MISFDIFVSDRNVGLRLKFETLVSTKDEVAQCFGDERMLDTTGGHSPGVAVPFIMQRAAGVMGSLDDSRASARDVIVPAEDAQYFCNPSNLRGRVYVRVRVCHDMFRTRSPMFDRLQK